MSLHRVLKFAASFVLVLACAAPSARAANWQWQLSPERYKGMNAFERAQYDKAAALVTAGNFAAAASEFEKFKVQFPDSQNLPYVIFMRGMSLHNAKNRHTAIKVYQEVLDYFADQVEDAAPALYHMGVAHLDNGDTLKGLQCMKTLVEDPRYQKHPLAAGALRRLAENHWNNKEFDQAATYWRQAITDFAGVNDEERNNAVQGLAGYHIINKGCAALEQFLTDDTNREVPAHRASIANTIFQRAWAMHVYNAVDRKKTPTEKEVEEERQAFYDWFKTTKPWWEKNNDAYGYFSRALQFHSYLIPKDKAERDRLTEEAVAFVKTVQDKAAADAQYVGLIDQLRNAKEYDRGRYLAGLMTDRMAAAFKEYELLHHEAATGGDASKWAAVESALLAIEAGGSPEWKMKAMAARADVYRVYMNQQEKAIAPYQQLNNPPDNLWAIADAYIRLKKLEPALTTLTEIENSFPEQAARAAYAKASHLKDAGEEQKAIAAARRVLKVYPKSPESSSAHQLLEGYGIATGGGLSDEQ